VVPNGSIAVLQATITREKPGGKDVAGPRAPGTPPPRAACDWVSHAGEFRGCGQLVAIFVVQVTQEAVIPLVPAFLAGIEGADRERALISGDTDVGLKCSGALFISSRGHHLGGGTCCVGEFGNMEDLNIVSLVAARMQHMGVIITHIAVAMPEQHVTPEDAAPEGLILSSVGVG